MVFWPAAMALACSEAPPSAEVALDAQPADLAPVLDVGAPREAATPDATPLDAPSFDAPSFDAPFIDQATTPPPRDAGAPVGRDATVATDVPSPVDSGGTPEPTRRPSFFQMQRRIVHARAYQNHEWTISGETPESVGRALARLQPTYVSGLLRIASDETLSAAQIADFNTIRALVRAASPDCQFDVVLNGQQYPTPNAMRDQMQRIEDAVHPDAWFFDFYYEAYAGMYRAPLAAAVTWAHAHREYIGGNTMGANHVPDSDFEALSPVSRAGRVADGDLDLRQDDIARLHDRGVPVLLHINNDPQFAPTTESCYFMGRSGIERYDWGYNRRVQWITSRAEDQSSWHFHFMYPVFFPECPLRVSYNAPRDGMMMSEFVALMRRYN